MHAVRAKTYNCDAMAPLPLMLGHRGARACSTVAENTRASFDLALKHGCDGFEFDVRLTACGRAVICHDPKVGRLTIAKTACLELRQLPVLSDILARYARRCFLDIELKVPGLESQVLLALREHPPERGHVVSSFLPEVLTAIRVRSETVPLGIIFDRAKDLDVWRELPVDFVMPEKTLITRKLVDDIHHADKHLLAWTVNDKKNMLRLANWGVDGIISDYTERLVQTFGPRTGVK